MALFIHSHFARRTLAPKAETSSKMAADAASKNLAEQLEHGKPEWLEEFLEKPYFKQCMLHHDNVDPGLSINKFCVDCKTPVCPRCILELGHATHAIIQVFRHVYQDAASAKAIKSFMNINDIQTYKSNQALVVALRPLRSMAKINHGGGRFDSSSSGGCNKAISRSTSVHPKNNQIVRKCHVCGKRLVPMHKFRYCSIQCKVMDYMKKSDHSKAPLLMPGTESLGEEGYNNGMFYENVKMEEKGGRLISRRRKRKGIPHRAPFF